MHQRTQQPDLWVLLNTEYSSITILVILLFFILQKCLAVQETVAVVLAASAAMAVEGKF